MTDLITIPHPPFDSELLATIVEVERLRADIGSAMTTPRETFIELHRLFDTVMSVISARIEGNRTTVYEAVETPHQGRRPGGGEQLREISNITEAARFLDELDTDQPLTHSLIRELHERIVRGLTREGDPTPGSYREVDVGIMDSTHVPPSWVTVHAEMTTLLDFANQDLPMHQQILQIAVAHHRFVWIHPFRNGNGRVSRLFTYAMLRRTIFARRGRSALNPTSVFGNDRSAYMAALESADSLTDDGLLEWAMFFASGIRDDLSRLIRLQDHQFVANELVGPALERLRKDEVISTAEQQALTIALEQGSVRAGELEAALPGAPSQRSRAIRSLLDRRLLTHADGPRSYRIVLASGPLAPRLIRQLDALGYLPRMLVDD